MNNATYPSIIERIGGRWALAPQKWVITFMLMPLLAAGYTKNLGSTKSVLLWFSFAIAGLCLVGFVDACLDRTIFRGRRECAVPAWWVIVNSAGGGLIIGSCAWVGGSLDEAADSTQMAIRIPGLMLLGALWGVFITLVLDYRDRATASRIHHIDQMVQLELVKMQQSAIVEEAIQSVRDETNREIGRMRESMAKIAELPSADASALLRSYAANSIQPLSRKLWESAKNSYPRLHLRDVLSHIVRDQPFRPWALTALIVALSVVDRMTRLGVGRGLAITSLIAFGTIIELSAANRILSSFPNLHTQVFIGTVVAIEIQTVALVVWERQLIDAPVSYAEIVVSVAASVFLIFLSVGLYSFDLLRGEVAHFATQGVEASRISSIARDHQISAALREMAQFLHGNVQTRLVSCAMALDLAAQAEDGESANAALLEARRALNATSTESTSSTVLVKDEILRKVSVWVGLCDCTVRIGQCVEVPDITMRVGRIVEEGIANAVRHGRATSVEIDISPGTENSVVIVVVDNGLGPQNGPLGVGSAIVENATGGLWSLRAGDRGSVLSATVRQ